MTWERNSPSSSSSGGGISHPGRAGATSAGTGVANERHARGHHKRRSVPADACTYDLFAANQRRIGLPSCPASSASMYPTPRTCCCACGDCELQQEESTADMILHVAGSSPRRARSTLEPGDVIATGPTRPVWSPAAACTCSPASLPDHHRRPGVPPTPRHRHRKDIISTYASVAGHFAGNRTSIAPPYGTGAWCSRRTLRCRLAQQ